VADLTPWLVTTLAFLPPLMVPLAFCARGPVGQRLVAVQLLTSLGVPLLATLTFVLTEASSIDLALAFGLLGAPASLLFAVVLERWL
jgi:multisubunit Na+/H+ antiporter MnhF subunit